MNYYDVYQSRLNHLGSTTAERIKNSGERSFYKWMAESPFTVINLSVERGLFFDGIIETNKDKEYEKIMFLRVANDVPIQVGDIMNWEIEDGTIEKWILAQKVKKTNGAYQTFWIIRCNYLLKWIDTQGHLQQSWAYFVSSVDSKIKGNYRTWNNLISPQPNKYAEVLMPRYPITRSTNFIVEEESWNVVEYDHTSVPGTIYLSLTENKVNFIYDDMVNNIADTDKLAQYQLLIPDNPLVYKVGDVIYKEGEISPLYTLTKNGVPYNTAVELVSTNKSIVRYENDTLIAVGVGEVDIKVRLKDYPQIEQTLTINVNNQEQEFAAYIEGPDTIRLARRAIFSLKSTSEITDKENIHFSVDNEELAKILEQANGSCTIEANSRNRLDDFIITAEYAGKTYEKKIKILPIW